MTRRKQFQPKRLTSSGDEEDDDDKDKKFKEMPVEEENFHKSNSFESKETELNSETHNSQLEESDSNHISEKMTESHKELGMETSCENKQVYSNVNGAAEDEIENVVEQDSKNFWKEHSPDTKNNIDDGVKKDNVKQKRKNMSDSEMEREIKKELKEAVEIRVPKIRTQKECDDYKWMNSGSSEKSVKQAVTPPLQKLMKQEFSPLKMENLSSPSPPKRFKESLSHKEGFTSKLASVIIPSTSVSLPPKTVSHPKQLLSHSVANFRPPSVKTPYYSKSVLSPSSFLPRSYSLRQSVYQSVEDEQPLDLSKKPGKVTTNGTSSPKRKHSAMSESRNHENGLSSTSLQSLQQKFGGDFHLRGLRKPLNYMLYGPEIPAIHQALLHSASMALPHFALPLSNGHPKLTPEKYHPSRHRNASPLPAHKIRSEEIVKASKREESTNEKSIKHEHVDKKDVVSESRADEKPGENYTNHLCTCGKWFDGLYSLSLHLQETGHLPSKNKSVSLLEYPKLVRGQDMWLNQESEQTRRILRCIQCGESFKTLPMLTVHMMKTQHYTKIVSSEHARRTHKCSAYCDKEQDKECVFKCKVCQESFSDMEGLANHMILSGHHKKQASRSHHSFNDMHFKKRKRYSFEESLNPYGNPSMAAIYDYKRNLGGGSVSPDMSIDDLEDSRISCENCGNKIETKQFVEHVKACLGQRLREDIARMEKENEKLIEREKRSSKDNGHESESSKSPQKIKLESNTMKIENDKGNEHPRIKSEFKTEPDEEKLDEKSMEDKKDLDKKSCIITDQETNESENSAKLESENDELELGEIRDKSKSILKEIQTLVERKGPSFDKKDSIKVERNDYKVLENGKTDKPDQNSPRKAVGKKLDIIDPDHVKTEGSDGYALSAMESFIKKSFNNKFDYRKGNIVINPNSSSDATVHPRPMSSAIDLDSNDYLSRYRSFYAALNLNLSNGFKKEEHESDKSKSQNGSDDEMKVENDREGNGSSKSPELDDNDTKDGRNSVKSEDSCTSSQLDKNENLEKKYLNIDETETTKSDKGKNSALDNLSSFVYGQNFTSEHPLDSLQKLIAKSDIPKLMGTVAASQTLQYLPPHLAFHQAGLPLNLTVKSQNADSDDGYSKMTDDDEESLSDCSDEQSEFRCCSCSRKFASKGSYRYHLSRCHLSSVKNLGIKEAFNMSPYVYLPLDHTAKFSKYYQMAKELARKQEESQKEALMAKQKLIKK